MAESSERAGALVRLLMARPNQIIMTSHAVDVLSEVAPEQILIVDKTQASSSFATSVPAVQSIIEHIGSIHNMQLARLWNARRLLLVEGKDVYILRLFQNILYPETKEPIDGLPNMSIGGWGGWNYAVGSSMLLKNAIGENIIAYCLLDSDYHTVDEVAERYADAEKRLVRLHIWSRKEVENYLLEPEAIARAMIGKENDGQIVPGAGQIKSRIEEIADMVKSEIEDALVELRLQKDRRHGYKHVIGPVREHVAKHWESFEGKVALVPGKKVLSLLFDSLQKEFSVSLTQGRVARAMRKSEIVAEMKAALGAIERNTEFPG